MERIPVPDHIKALVKGLPGARLNFGITDSKVISPSGDEVPITILAAEIVRPGEQNRYVVLAEKISGEINEFNLVIKDPTGTNYVFSTPGFGELTGLAPDVVCGGSGKFRRRLLEDIYGVASAQSSTHHRAINLIPEIPPTLAHLPFP